MNPGEKRDEDNQKYLKTGIAQSVPWHFFYVTRNEKWLLERIDNPYVFPTTTVWQRIGSESKKLAKKIIQLSHRVPLDVREHMRVDVHGDIDGTMPQNLLHDFWMHPFA